MFITIFVEGEKKHHPNDKRKAMIDVLGVSDSSSCWEECFSMIHLFLWTESRLSIQFYCLLEMNRDFRSSLCRTGWTRHLFCPWKKMRDRYLESLSLDASYWQMSITVGIGVGQAYKNGSWTSGNLVLCESFIITAGCYRSFLFLLFQWIFWKWFQMLSWQTEVGWFKTHLKLYMST